MENPTKWMIWGYPLFSETSKWILDQGTKRVVFGNNSGDGRFLGQKKTHAVRAFFRRSNGEIFSRKNQR